MIDTVPSFKLYVYPFMTGDLLQFNQKPLLEEQRTHILRSALTGLAALHDRRIFHTGEYICSRVDLVAVDLFKRDRRVDVMADIKPNNILIDYEEGPDGSVMIQDVKLADLEDAVLLEPGTAIEGAALGNKLWRSPESWTGATQEHPSDVFSFGVVAIYVMANRMVFYSGLTDEQVNGDNAWWHILRKHLSLFGTDTESLRGLVRHVGGEDSPWFNRFADLASSFGDEDPRRPFALWMWLDESFRDLVGKNEPGPGEEDYRTGGSGSPLVHPDEFRPMPPTPEVKSLIVR